MLIRKQNENSENEVAEEQEEWLKSTLRCYLTEQRCSSNASSSKSITNDAEENSKVGGSEVDSLTSEEELTSESVENVSRKMKGWYLPHQTRLSEKQNSRKI